MRRVLVLVMGVVLSLGAGCLTELEDVAVLEEELSKEPAPHCFFDPVARDFFCECDPLSSWQQPHQEHMNANIIREGCDGPDWDPNTRCDQGGGGGGGGGGGSGGGGGGGTRPCTPGLPGCSGPIQQPIRCPDSRQVYDQREGRCIWPEHTVCGYNPYTLELCYPLPLGGLCCCYSENPDGDCW